MKIIKRILVLVLLLTLSSTIAQAQGKDCSCPVVSCGPCQKKVTIGKVVKFCDWGDINVCRKVICENVSFYFGCLSSLKKKEDKVSEEKGDIELAYEKNKEKSKSEKVRRPASRSDQSLNAPVALQTEGRLPAKNQSKVDPGQTYSDVNSGKVAEANSEIKHLQKGQIKKLKAGAKLFVGDEIYNESQKTKKLVLDYSSGQVDLWLKAKSRFVVEDPNSIVGRFQPFIYLLHGAIDYKPKLAGAFDVLAGQILTRASEGRYSVGYQMQLEGLKVRVETLSGLAKVFKAQNLVGGPVEVKPGEFVSWVSETPGHLFTADEKQALASEGFITPVFQMPEARRKTLGLLVEEKTLFKDWSAEPAKSISMRGPASASTEGGLCSVPAARYQQCAWSCEGNKKGSKNCKADQENVRCVRRVCNAAGQWGVPTAFASSYSDLCPAEGVRVGDCQP